MSASKTKIVFVIPTLEKGGAEKVLVHFVNNIDTSRFEPIIFCLKKKGELIAEISEGIRIVDIDYPRVYFSIFRLRKWIKEVEADVVIGWLGNVNAILAFFKPLLPRKLTLLCRESSIPSLFNQHYRLPFLFNFFYRFYNRFDGIICQSVAMQEDLVRNFNVRPAKTRVINNPVLVRPATEIIPAEVASFISDSGKLLLFVGRFSREKQVDVLLDIIPLLPDSYRLLIVGYGPLEQELRSKMLATRIEDRVRIVGNCSNPTLYYQRADCLLLTSSFEGFPNVLLEANAQGCPVVVYKTKGGAKEIVTESNGIYIGPEDTGGYASVVSAIDQVCNGKEQYDRKAIAASVAEKYSVRRIVDNYSAFIEETMNKKP